jgi:hypothetical protein
MITVGVILHKLRIGEMDTKLGGTEIDVESMTMMMAYE